MSLAVVVPYAGEPDIYLQRTIDSVYELSKLVRLYIVKDLERTGLASTLNKGFAEAIEAGCKHIAWLSTGDVLHPMRFEMPMPTRWAQFCRVRVEPQGFTTPRTEYRPADWYECSQACLTGAVWPAEVWQALGGADESLRYCADYDLGLRTAHHFGWEQGGEEVLATAFELPGGLTDRAKSGEEKTRRNADRAKVHRLARMLKRERRENGRREDDRN